jgi:hypothetical protein
MKSYANIEDVPKRKHQQKLDKKTGKGNYNDKPEHVKHIIFSF